MVFNVHVCNTGQYVGLLLAKDSVSLGCIICGSEDCALSLISMHNSEVRTGVTCNAGFIAVNFPPLIKAQKRK
jgi:hypothetical protein